MRQKGTACSGQREATLEAHISIVSEVLKCKLQTALRKYKENHLESWYRLFKSPKSKHRYRIICEAVENLTEKTVDALALVASLLESDSIKLKYLLSGSVFLSLHTVQNGCFISKDESDLISDTWLERHRVVRVDHMERYRIEQTDTAKTLNKWIERFIQECNHTRNFNEKKDTYTQSMKVDQSMRIDGTERGGVEMKSLKEN